MLQPLVRRSWAPRGQTPILRQWDRRDRLSTISALTVSPRRQRFNLYWTLHSHNIRSAEVLHFLKELRRHLPLGFILIWDRGRAHRAKNVQLWLADRERIDVEWLPPYARISTPWNASGAEPNTGIWQILPPMTSVHWNTPSPPLFAVPKAGGICSMDSFRAPS